VDIDQCPLPPGSKQLNIFAASDKCKKRTTEVKFNKYIFLLDFYIISITFVLSRNKVKIPVLVKFVCLSNTLDFNIINEIYKQTKKGSLK
jgi:hypothetical protein